MAAMDTIRRAAWAGFVISVAQVAHIDRARPALTHSAGEARRPRSTLVADATDAAWLVSPTEPLDFSAAPMVTCPVQCVARFSVAPLPLVAGEIGVERSRETHVSRIGGRHGP